MASAKQAALTKARERRVELDRDRAARDGRIEAAAAEVFVQQQARADAAQSVADADVKIGAALRLLLADGVGVEGVAQLCDVTMTEVRRLTRTGARNDQTQIDPGDKGGGDVGQRAQVTELRHGQDSASGLGAAAFTADHSNDGCAGRRSPAAERDR